MSRKWALGDNRSCALSKSQALVTMSDSMESKTQQVVIPGKNGLGLWDLREGGLRGSLWQSYPGSDWCSVSPEDEECLMSGTRYSDISSRLQTKFGIKSLAGTAG